ncbi:MAG: lytic murein transglycosylase [Smithella sp.]
MNLRYLLVIVSIAFIFWGCTSYNEQVKKIPDSGVSVKIKELKKTLIANGVPGEWFDKQIQHETFQIYPNIDQYFQKSAEKLTDFDKRHDISWYFARIGVDAKIKKGKPFIEDRIEMFNRAEAKHGIHKELIAAIIGVETNFADHQQRGRFYAFNSLVSQYIFTNRTKFAVSEITALYKFSQITKHPPQYFTSSYAGAIGWGQFIPSSLLAFFINSNGIDDDIDPFSIEDTIFSVENYLYKHNLSGANIGDDDIKYKAVFSYNHSDVYVKAVLYIYDGLRDYFSPAETDVRAEQPANN